MKIGRYIKNILWKKDKKILEIYNTEEIINNYYKILAIEALADQIVIREEAGIDKFTKELVKI